MSVKHNTMIQLRKRSRYGSLKQHVKFVPWETSECYGLCHDKNVTWKSWRLKSPATQRRNYQNSAVLLLFEGNPPITIGLSSQMVSNTESVLIWGTWLRDSKHALHSWWRHQMETFSALLALCVGNSRATVEFPAQRPMTRSFDVFCDFRLNKRLSNNHEAGDLRRHHAHCDVIVMYTVYGGQHKVNDRIQGHVAVMKTSEGVLHDRRFAPKLAKYSTILFQIHLQK